MRLRLKSGCLTTEVNTDPAHLLACVDVALRYGSDALWHQDRWIVLRSGSVVDEVFAPTKLAFPFHLSGKTLLYLQALLKLSPSTVTLISEDNVTWVMSNPPTVTVA
mgnify:CR=1 FL=1